MTDDEKELNSKILEWLGMFNHYFVSEKGLTERPDCIQWFTRSMDTCLEYIEPVVRPKGFTIKFDAPYTRDAWGCYLMAELWGMRSHYGWADTAPLAFCRAVEQLIDGENK